MIRSLRLLNVRPLVRHPLRAVLAALAVAAGTSLALSVLIVSSSVSTSLVQFGRDLAGIAPLRVVGATSSAGIEAGTLADVATVPGVKRAIPIVEAATVLRIAPATGAPASTRPVAVLGVTCAAAVVAFQHPCADLGAQAGTSTAFPANLVLTSPALARALTPGSWIETNTGVASLGSAVALPALSGVGGGHVVVMALARAQALFDRHGRLDAIYVVLRPGAPVATVARRLDGAVGNANAVLGSTQLPPEVGFALATFLPLLTLLALLATVIAAVLVYNVVNLSLEQRRRDLAIAAAIGAPPPVLVAGPLAEAGILGAVGGLGGVALGALVAGSVVHSFAQLSAGFFGIPIGVHIGTLTIVAGMAIGLAVATGATAIPARRQLRVDVAAELAGRAVERGTVERGTVERGTARRGHVGSRLGLAALTAAGICACWAGQRSGGLAGWQLPVGLAGFLAATLGSALSVALVAPVALRTATAVHRRRDHGRRARGIIHLAAVNVLRSPGRTGVTAVAVSAPVVTAFLTASYALSLHMAIAAGLQHGASQRAVEVSTVANHESFNTDARIPSADARVLAGLGGVARADPFTAVIAGHTTSHLVEVEALTRWPAGAAVVAGTNRASAFAGGDVLVGTAAARTFHLHPGSTMHLATPAGRAAVRVEGIWQNGNAAGMNVTMSSAAFHHLYGDQLPLAIDLVARRGVAPRRIVREAMHAHLSPALVFSTPSERLASDSAASAARLAPFWALQQALLLVAFVSVLATLLLAGIQRRREMGLLAAVGATPATLSAMVLAEAGWVGVVGAASGIAAGFVMLVSLVWVTPFYTGVGASYSPAASSLIVAVPVAVAVAVVGAILPAWRGARLGVLDALQYE